MGYSCEVMADSADTTLSDNNCNYRKLSGDDSLDSESVYDDEDYDNEVERSSNDCEIVPGPLKKPKVISVIH